MAFEVGQRILVPWTDGESYFANVKRIIDNDHIEVVFDNDDIETINLQVTRVKRVRMKPRPVEEEVEEEDGVGEGDEDEDEDDDEDDDGEVEEEEEGDDDDDYDDDDDTFDEEDDDEEEVEDDGSTEDSGGDKPAPPVSKPKKRVVVVEPAPAVQEPAGPVLVPVKWVYTRKGEDAVIIPGSYPVSQDFNALIDKLMLDFELTDNFSLSYDDDEDERVTIKSQEHLTHALQSRVGKAKPLRVYLEPQSQRNVASVRTLTSTTSTSSGRHGYSDSMSSFFSGTQAVFSPGDDMRREVSTPFSRFGDTASTGLGSTRPGTSFGRDFSAINPEEGVKHWKRGQLLGSGSFGKVYAGLDQKTGTHIAVKQVRISVEPSKRSKREVEALEREIALLRQMQHPNIVQYYGTARKDDKLYIFLEFCSGGSVASALSRFGPFSEAIVRRYTCQVLQGLDYLHANGIIHRDIKGSNLLIEHGVIKLADFGCSKKLEFSEGGEDGSEQMHTAVGTTQFMAPEIMKGTEKYGRKADIWSLGMAVLEMATGKPAWPNPSQALFKLLATEELPPLPPTLSSDGHDFLLQCFQRDPAKRPDAATLLSHPFLNEAEDPEMFKNPVIDDGEASVGPDSPAPTPPVRGAFAFPATPTPAPTPATATKGKTVGKTAKKSSPLKPKSKAAGGAAASSKATVKGKTASKGGAKKKTTGAHAGAGGAPSRPKSASAKHAASGGTASTVASEHTELSTMSSLSGGGSKHASRTGDSSDDDVGHSLELSSSHEQLSMRTADFPTATWMREAIGAAEAACRFVDKPS